jgi:hypothetical protein
MLGFLLALCSSNATPSGTLWTPDTPFNFTAYPTIVRDVPFRILQLTDLHVHETSADSLNAFTVAHLLITSTNPDLIIMTGDSTGTAVNEIWAATLVEFFDNYSIPYTFVFGNHDAEGLDDEDIGNILKTGLFSWFDRGPGSIHGYSNSVVTLVNGAGRLIYSLILLDSGRYRDYSSTADGYDYIYPDQGKWYEWVVAGLQAQGTGKNSLFYHIPLPEMKDVKADYEKVDPAGAADAFREQPDPSGQNSGFWDSVKSVGETTHMFVGHDHTNRVNYVWNGVHWVYGLKTGKCSYHDDDRIGGTLITIGQDANVTVDFVLETDVPEVPEVREFLNRKANARPKIRVKRPRKA